MLKITDKEKIRLPDCKPFSINMAYYKKTMTLTRECRAWRTTIFKALKHPENLEAMKNIREKFDPFKHGISVAISFGVKWSNFFTRSHTISKLSKDLTNVEKLLVDCIFDQKFYERGDIENLNIDDKHIIKLYSEKIPRDSWEIVVELGLIDIDFLMEENCKR